MVIDESASLMLHFWAQQPERCCKSWGSGGTVDAADLKSAEGDLV